MIYVDLWERKLHFKEWIDYNGEFCDEHFRVGIGRDETPTPTGIFMVKRKIIFPESYYLVESGFEGRYGDCVLELNISGKDMKPYCIHGVGDTNNIRKKHTRGCISMLADDLHFVFNHVEKGHKVIIWFGVVNEENIPNWRQIRRWPPPENSLAYRRNEPLFSCQVLPDLASNTGIHAKK